MSNLGLKQKASSGNLTLNEWLKFGANLGEKLNLLRKPQPKTPSKIVTGEDWLKACEEDLKSLGLSHLLKPMDSQPNEYIVNFVSQKKNKG